MYGEGQEGSPRDKLLVYAGMSNICSEFSGMDDGDAADYNHNLARSFSCLLLQALATFPMLAPASMDTVEALLAAVSSTGIWSSHMKLTSTFTGIGIDDNRHVQAVAVVVSVMCRCSNVSKAGLQSFVTRRFQLGSLVQP